MKTAEQKIVEGLRTFADDLEAGNVTTRPCDCAAVTTGMEACPYFVGVTCRHPVKGAEA